MTNENPDKKEMQNTPQDQPDEKVDTSAQKETSQEKTADEVAVAEPPAEKDEEFNWETSNKASVRYSTEEYKKYEKAYEDSLTSIDENDIVQGKIASIGDGDVVLDLNYKSDGVVSLNEFRSKELNIGDIVDVYVEKLEDERGQLVLSRRKAKLLKAWEKLVDSYENSNIIEGVVLSKTKGGLIVDVDGLETFLPGSQIDIKPITDYDAFVGKTMEFKVVKINEQIKNAVVSHKALIESELEEQREQIISQLEKGQVLEGTVKNITDFGAFMDLGGVDGLLYITDISWGRIEHPEEVLEVDQKLNVVVLDFNEDKKRISLGLKQLEPHPWENLPEEFKEGSVVNGKVVNIEDYGAFLEIAPGIEGLVHVSEISWSTQQINANNFFSLGEEREAKIVGIEPEERKMSLSIKQLDKDPWEDIAQKFPEDSRHSAEVKNLMPYGVFVELEEGIPGMIHISDLSWTKRYSHPSEFTKVGDTLEVVVLNIDEEGRKLSLGHKQLEENPWNTFQDVFPVGSYHEATVLRKDDRGAIVQLPYGLEAYAPLRHIRKEDGSYADPEESLTVKVIEFNRDDKRIMVSHLRYLEDLRKEAKAKVEGEQKSERRKVKRDIRKQKSKVERTTLGELGVFSQMKEQLFTGEEE